jgi:hypothetical protein
MDEYQNSEKLAEAKAFYQLAVYLKALELPFSVSDLYRDAYQNQTNPRMVDTSWLDQLEKDPNMQQALSEPFTTQTIMETLLRTGHEAVIKQLMKRVREYGIGFAHAYVLGISRWK